MPGHSRIGIGVQSDKGYVKVASVLPDGPAARILSVDDIILAVNGKPVANTGMCTEDDACAVQKQIVFATNQCTSTGRMLPVRLTIATLTIASPKGIEADLDYLGLAESEWREPKPMPPPGMSDVAQVL